MRSRRSGDGGRAPAPATFHRRRPQADPDATGDPRRGAGTGRAPALLYRRRESREGRSSNAAGTAQGMVVKTVRDRGGRGYANATVDHEPMKLSAREAGKRQRVAHGQPRRSGRSGKWSQPGSNRRPSGCQPDALPAELWPLGLRIVAPARTVRPFPQVCPQISADVPTGPSFFSTGAAQSVGPDVPDRRLPSRSAHPPRTVLGRRPESDPDPRAVPHGPGRGEVGAPARRRLRQGLPPHLRRVPRPRRGSLPGRVEQPLRAPGRGVRRPSLRPAGALGALRPLLAGAAVAVAVAGVAAWKLGSDGKAVRSAPPATTTTRPRAAKAAAWPRRRRPRPRTRCSARHAGNCWLLVRRAGASGPVLFERTLAQGRNASASGRHCALGAHRRAVEPRPQRRRPPRRADCRPHRRTSSSRRAESPPPRRRPPRPRPRARRSRGPRACSTTAPPA